MDLILPDFGLLFWTGLVFIILMFILTKFIWKPILSSVNARSEKIAEALEMAEKTKAEMKSLQAANENLLKEARAERDAIVKDAKETATKMVEDAKTAAKVESEKVVAAARQTIASEKVAAIAELKTQVASFSIEIAEKIVRAELSSDAKQKALAEKMAGDINLN
ncbi:MAG: synthase subunit [Bacteroidota bacterium]|jgi:F-type H+-transporting ATPase subunit b